MFFCSSNVPWMRRLEMMSPGTLWVWDWTGDQKSAEGMIYKVWLLIMKGSHVGCVVQSALLCHHPFPALTLLVLHKLTLVFCLQLSTVSLISNGIVLLLSRVLSLLQLQLVFFTCSLLQSWPMSKHVTSFHSMSEFWSYRKMLER